MTLIEGKAIARFGADGRMLLHSANFIVNHGDKIVLHGASGGGKSVLLRTIAMLDAPDEGQILWQGAPLLSREQVATYRVQVAYVRQQPIMQAGSAEDNLCLPFVLKAYRHLRYERTKIETMLATIGKSAALLSRESSELSGGEMQLIGLMRLLQLEPRVLLLDEPTAALDPDTALGVEHLVAQWQTANPERAYIWITHSMAQLEHIGDIRWYMDAGRLTIEGAGR